MVISIHILNDASSKTHLNVGIKNDTFKFLQQIYSQQLINHSYSQLFTKKGLIYQPF
jgi:hypothetical protein